MRPFFVLSVGLGLALLGVLIAQTDLGEVAGQLARVGLTGALVLLAVHVAAFLSEVVSWQLTLTRVPLAAPWTYRLWKTLMFGSALERVTPLAGLGGEPIKAVVLKRAYGVPWADSMASLLLTRMTDVMALVAFVTLGMVLVVSEGVLSETYRWVATGGLVLLVVNTMAFFVLQRFRVFSRLRRFLDGRAPAAPSEGLRRALDAIEGVEDQLVRFYTAEPIRFSGSVLATFCEWMLGAVTVCVGLAWLGHPVPFEHAVIIEAVTLLVVSTFFFVPGDIGTQEAAIVVVCGELTGAPSVGLALATLRRARDILWVAWGLAIGGTYSIGGRDEILAEARRVDD